MTAELTEARLQVMKSIYRHDPEVRAAIDMALAHVRARGQEPVATKLVSDPYDERGGSWFSAADLKRINSLPVGTSLYALPPATYAEGVRDGMLKAAKHFELLPHNEWWTPAIAERLRALAEKEGA